MTQLPQSIRVAAAVWAALIALSPSAAAQGSTAFFEPGSKRAQGSAAVDANGRSYDGTKYNGLAPWERDAVKTAAPGYSYAARRDRREGEGIVRLTLDLKTGAPREVRMLKSTGHASLDASAVAAFRRWRWRPGKWQQVDIPVTFIITRAPPPRGAIRLPSE